MRGRMKRYLALDIGDVRIGVARSDLMGIIATPLETINRKKVKSVKRIVELCKENNTSSIVVGIPKSLDGEKNDELADSVEPEVDAASEAESAEAEDYAADNSSEDVDDAAAADAAEAEAADAEENNAEVAGVDADDSKPADTDVDAAESTTAEAEPADELADATAAENATDDSEVTDVPDDWNMINVPRSKPVR